MFHSVPREVGYGRVDDSPPLAHNFTSVDYDFNQYLGGDVDTRQLSIDMPGTMTSDSSSQQRHTMEWTQQFSAQLEMTPPGLLDLDGYAFEQPSDTAFSITDSWQRRIPMPSSTTALPSDSNQRQPIIQPQLPSQERVLDMVNSFFSAQHQLLPSVHRESFMTRLMNDMIGFGSGPFLWVILALYCSCNKSESMQGQYRDWMQTAHSKLELMSTTRVGSNTTNMLQASVWMIFDAYCRGDVTNAWLLLGRAAQLTSALGLDRIDSEHRTPRMESEMKSRSSIEVEERRKCMWCLALLDRVIVSVNGLALSMDDRYFHIDFPLPDEEFQDARSCIEDIEYLRESYSTEAFDLLNRNATSAMATNPSFEHLLKVSVILGRALAIQNSIRHDDGSTHKQHLEMLRTLESVLNTFCYAASASGEGVGPTSLMQLRLKMLTQCSRILMLHPPRPSTLGLCKCLDSSSPGVPPSRMDTECVKAAMTAASTFSHALKGSLMALNNPFLLPVACTSVRMLTTLRNQMHELDRERVRELIGKTLMVVDHIAIKFPGAAGKARETIMQRVNECEYGTRRTSFSCYVGLDCD